MALSKKPIEEPDEDPTSVSVEDSIPIKVETETPLPVVIENKDLAHLKGKIASTTSDTPEADARMLAAKRQNTINSLWEYTQAILAVVLTLAAVYVAVVSRTPESETLKNALFVVLGFYFGRTNHTRPTPSDPGGTGEHINV